MPRTNVYIDRQLCDFEEIEGLPLELNISIDNFLSLDTRLTPTRLDGGIDQLVLPATKQNNAILSQFWEFGSPDASKEIVVDVDGQPIFTGKCKPTEAIRSWTQPKQYFLELYGGAGSPLSDLEGLLLTDIDMDGIATDSAAVTSSWTHNFGSSAATATFAPVMYGRPVANNPTKYYQQIDDLRPHIPYTTIFNKIFESHLGFKINSDFYDREAFRRMHYMFGVGNQWERTFDTSTYEFEYQLNSALSGSPPVGLNKIPYGTLVSDPQSMWDGTNHFFTAPVDGYYSFEIEYSISNVFGSYTLKISTYGPGAHNLIESQYAVSGIQVINHKVNLPLQYYNAGQSFFILSNTADTNVEVIADSSIRGKLDPAAFMGADVKVQTCLHKRPVKDFLKAVFHQFNLTGRFELITKQFYFEPRMAYYNANTYGTGAGGAMSRTEYDGYYLRPLTSVEDWTDKVQPETIRIKKLYPFGDNLTLAYKKAKDSVTEAVLRDGNEDIEGLEGIPPVYGVKYPMSEISTGQGDKVIENPYFHPLPNIAVNEIQPGIPLPSMMPKDYEFDGPLPEPTFEFEPTCGFYYGLSAVDAWKYEGAGRTLPMMYMQPPLGGTDYVSNQDCITFNNTGAYIGGNRSNNKGLVENYYFNYLQCIKHGEVVEAEVILTPSEAFSETFTKLKQFLQNTFILLSIERYNPLTNRATCKFFRYTYGMTSSEYAAFEAGQSDVYNTYFTK